MKSGLKILSTTVCIILISDFALNNTTTEVKKRSYIKKSLIEFNSLNSDIFLNSKLSKLQCYICKKEIYLNSDCVRCNSFFVLKVPRRWRKFYCDHCGVKSKFKFIEELCPNCIEEGYSLTSSLFESSKLMDKEGNIVNLN